MPNIVNLKPGNVVGHPLLDDCFRIRERQENESDSISRLMHVNTQLS